MFKIGTIALMLYMLSVISSDALAVPAGQIVTWEGGGPGAVKFDGEEHSEKGYKCESCHPSLFEKKKVQQK